MDFKIPSSTLDKLNELADQIMDMVDGQYPFFIVYAVNNVNKKTEYKYFYSAPSELGYKLCENKMQDIFDLHNIPRDGTPCSPKDFSMPKDEKDTLKQTLNSFMFYCQNAGVPCFVQIVVDNNIKDNTTEYIMDIVSPYRLLKELYDDINVNVNDELIDLSPCIGIWQEAEYFINYDIDAQIEFAKEHHKEKVFPKLPEDSSVDDKILLLTAIETNYNRYITQVKTPFIDDEQKNTILDRLGTVFDGREDVQGNCLMRFMGSPGNILNICGRYDVLKNNIIYELKFKSELSHEDHLQLACYLVALGKEKGILWNVKTGTMYEITVPDKRKFLDAVAKCITKGKVKRFIEASRKIN